MKTNPNKAKVNIGKMNISIAVTKDYDNEQPTTNVIKTNPNKAKRRQICERLLSWMKILAGSRPLW